MRKIILTLALAATGFTAAACTAQAMPAAAPNQTRVQALAQADARFAEIDTNHDGLIGTTEMQAYRAAIHDRMIARGGDGAAPSAGVSEHGGMGRFNGPEGNASMTRADFEARAGERFDRVDANHDGTIDATERANQAEMRRVDRRERRGRAATAPAPIPAN